MFAIKEINPIKKDIMEAIIDLVYRDGVKGLSIRTMAKKISYSTGPIYYHFKDRDELLVQIYMYCCFHFMKNIDKNLLTNIKDSKEVIYALLCYCCDIFYNDKYFKVQVLIAPSIDTKYRYDYWESVIDDYLNKYSISKNAGNTKIKKDNINIVGKIFTLAINGFFNCVLRNETISSSEKEKICYEYANFIYNGLIPLIHE